VHDNAKYKTICDIYGLIKKENYSNEQVLDILGILLRTFLLSAEESIREELLIDFTAHVNAALKAIDQGACDSEPPADASKS
jgi:hypothetical protein